jgi:mannose-6-phosphate isomerase-like protein (cupin superfamily)
VAGAAGREQDGGMTTTTSTQPVHRPAGEALSRSFLGGRADVRLTSEDTAGWLCLHDHRLPVGTASPLHVHPADDESFLVLEGAVEFALPDGNITVAADDALHIPRGVPHAFRIASPEGARLLIVGTPAGHERFFLEAGDPLDAPAPPDMGRLVAAAASAGFEILGPPPFDA